MRRKGQWDVLFDAITFGKETIRLNTTGAALVTGANTGMGATRHSNGQYSIEYEKRSGLPDLTKHL
ncbi:Vacuolar protease A [Xylographa pallens]|nr:Vacuolar protease A [Xylographa pallens]